MFITCWWCPKPPWNIFECQQFPTELTDSCERGWACAQVGHPAGWREFADEADGSCFRDLKISLLVFLLGYGTRSDLR